MVAISNEALEWLDRAEQAREAAGQLTDPGARKAVLQVADTFDRLARAAAARAVARKRELVKSEGRPHDFSRPSLIPTETAPRQEEYERVSDRGGTREDHRTSRLADRSLCRAQGGDSRGEDERVKRLEAEIDDLLRETEEVEKWATVGSA
jgi:hypothetical protein